MICYQVCIFNTYHDYFDYLPNETLPRIGARVWVPFRHQQKLGIVIGIQSYSTTSKPLKTIEKVIDEDPLLSEDMLKLAKWVSQYYQAPLSEVLTLMLPKRHRLAKEIRAVKESKKREHNKPPILHALNEEQKSVLNQMEQHLNAYHCALLYGVTGSGKTEIYLQLTAKILAQGKQALILVPEIGLTPQLIERFSSRFSEKMVVIHSHVSETTRQQAWMLAQTRQARLVLGTRSAIFTPMPDLGLVIIDEEHDASFKQMDGVRYSARDTALIRAYHANVPIVLGSATPSLESLHNSQIGKYVCLRLNHKAKNQTPLHYHIIDIRNQPLHHGLSTTTLSMMDQTLQQGNQVLVFLNRRGYSPVLLCHQCGWIADCHACDTHFTLHKDEHILVCHHCGARQPQTRTCPKCCSHELIPVGTGTQRIDTYLQTYFPNTAMLRVDRDTVGKKNAMNDHLDQIHKGEAQLIIGTQMLAKGHDFPRLTLVVILDADNGFHHHDFRALEHLGQLLTQVAGRAGRALEPGQVIIQTHIPQHPLLLMLIQQGYDAFSKALLSMRENAELPPFTYLAMIRAQGKQAKNVLDFLKQIKEYIQSTHLLALGPAPAPLAKKAGLYRMQLLLKSASRKQLAIALNTLRQTMLQQKQIKGVRWSIDVDPIDLS